MEKSRIITAVHVAVAIILSVGLLVIGAAAAERYQLPFIHGWALMHGTLFVVFPVYFLVSFFSLQPLARRLHLRYSATASQTRRVSQLAVWSLLLSGAGFLIPLVGSIPAIVLGHLGRRRCRAQPHLYGSGIALAGLVVGYAGLAYNLYVIGMVSWVAGNRSS